jgi:DNA-damage-inducible protein J
MFGVVLEVKEVLIMDATKKKIQANVDRDSEERAKQVLSSLGISTSSIINAMFKRIAAEGKIPFALELTEDELADIRLAHAVENSKTPVLTDPKEIQDYLFGDDDDSY